MLRERGVRIVVCRGFLALVSSDWANLRRNRPATPAELDAAVSCDRDNVLAVFESDLNSVVCPVAPLERPANKRLDREYVALHEIGHALTLRAAWRAAPTRKDLIEGLTPPLMRHLSRYRQGDSAAAIRERVTEVLAESYRLLISGLDREIPPVLLSALLDILGGDDLRPHLDQA